ncbi:MAG: GyrI-like domain-containing protein [Chloroflexia bacterium]|nr:GyrI-like domain-containing protein [Chloroflexia bacterium]
MFREIQLQEAIVVKGVSIKLSNSQNKNYLHIRELWQSFNAQLANNEIKLERNWRKFGVVFRAENAYFYLAGINCLENFYGFESINLLGGAYASFRHHGAMSKLKDFYYHLYKKIIPDMNLNINKNREILHYELYTNQFNWNNANSVIDIFVPLSSEN